MKELEHAKKLLNQQHEDDLEQLMALKKQLEKKVIFLNIFNKRISKTLNLAKQKKILDPDFSTL